MITKINDNKLTTHINSISPSQYYSALNCPYKLVLANSYRNTPLLPLNANAHFGSITHKIIELISKGAINDEQSFSENWICLINQKEEELKEKGFSNIIPLKYHVADFALKKNQIKNVLLKRKEKINTNLKTSSNKYFSEMRLENHDKRIKGISDLIIENDFETTILDFKTGKIYSDAIDECGTSEPVIKKEYEIQLKLYAHLYFLMKGKYPTKLFLVTLSNDFIEVHFNHKECESIYSEAINFLTNTNLTIIKMEFIEIAKPSIVNCKYCSSRPACSFYSNWLAINFADVNDIIGIIKGVRLFNNNTLGIELQINNNIALINGLPSNFMDGLENPVNKKVAIYNLKKNKQSINATATDYTIAYANT